ncbi:biotin transporter BioY [Treponema ruminis]|uniref:Biotin transporter n=1 Tax=Treponema ruminis TaxID=744515 RepID=A0A7W8G7N0_9SPIR|nr:biotin transporter BioY [Treponema ruminis]MBB5225341.1 biotin transport system substrate-specific component [Treponema ruminis]QSI01788.1 biotin transporter BioY [Treponema ruminis]
MKSRKYVFTALFAALISIGCVIAIPLPGGVPITVQNLFCILAGGILGTFYGAFSVFIWMILGAVGIPVFANAHGGLAIILGPTGGYMWGYALGSLFLGLALGKPKFGEKKKDVKFIIKIALLSLIAYALVYLPGIPWFMHVMAGKGKPQTFQSALKLTFIPFIPGDLIKWAVTIPLIRALRPVAARYLNSEE